jgi:NAD(P)-dependent dehydrogenase (short-subunit alcohol dehydrogenase family)
VHVYALDVCDAVALQRAADDFIAQAGLPDIVIANAGVSAGTLTEYAEDLDVYQRVMDINVLGMVKTFQPYVAAMRDARHGTLVGIASVAGFRGLPGAGAYSASKAAAISYLESLRVELHGSGVQVVTICPGYVKTPMTAVNPYPMPFILEVDEAARRIARAIGKQISFAVIPWQMGIVGWLLKRLPRGVYDRLFARAPHKPRGVI